LSRLDELAHNLWWSWRDDARLLFESLDRTLWESTEQNPVRLLHELPAERLEEAAEDPAFRKRYQTVIRAFDLALAKEDFWIHREHPEMNGALVAYFSAEFGLHNSLPIYSGGLGVLAGDHCKEASSLGVPFIGVGFMYPKGYFHQRLSSGGWQEPSIEVIDWSHAPAVPILDANGQRVIVDVEFAARRVRVAAYEVCLGHVRLVLLDTDLDGNDDWDRQIAAQLYGGDQRMRLAQEIILGVGGVRMLRALGVSPSVWHANEGHVAFLMLERLREAVGRGETLRDAIAEVQRSTVFTTHTPVAAGHDAFPKSLKEDYFRGYWGPLEAMREEVLALGRDEESRFNMTIFSLRLAGRRNAVSKLHGKVARRMWNRLWPDTPEDQVPIESVTNGVHVPTWVGGEMRELYKRYLGPDWLANHDKAEFWSRLELVPDDELWRMHLRQKRQLVGLVRERARQRWVRGLHEPSQIVATGNLLDPESLTIGFARRFATYKRATLIFHDLDLLLDMLGDASRPLQIIFAGKAHPADDPGKHLIQEVYQKALDRRIGGRIAFIEDYDLRLAKGLVAGVDVWLNSPRPPLEACGTSGQKAGLNGVPQLSVLDGWWYEGYEGANGWAFGQTLEAPGEVDDAADAADLYRVLTEDVIPLYYARDPDNVPRGWCNVMKEAIRSVATHFSARRMVKEYVERFYIPAARDAGAIPNGAAERRNGAS
ncbi:MAG: alpha-glucan family phosphorylase, partial [Candidatus Binatia bacterium]